jgi:hypothetical protein
MKKLIKKLRKEIYKKPAPGPVLLKLADQKLREISQGYEHNADALWIGSYLADFFIWEAIQAKDIKKHVPMAAEYAKELAETHNISKSELDIILEIIETHHGGKQKYIESKLYKNADCFKFLEPEGAFHIFSAFYDETEESMKKAMEYLMFKIEEKYGLVDLNDELKNEAKKLYNQWHWFFKRTDYKIMTPDLYK